MPNIAGEIEDPTLYGLGINHRLLNDINTMHELSLINMPNEDEVVNKVLSEEKSYGINNKK